MELVEGGVGVHGGGIADVAPFGIADEDGVGREEISQAAEEAVAFDSEGQEECQVGFVGGGVPGGGVDDGAEEGFGAVDIAGNAGRETPGINVKADADVGAAAVVYFLNAVLQAFAQRSLHFGRWYPPGRWGLNVVEMEFWVTPEGGWRGRGRSPDGCALKP